MHPSKKFTCLKHKRLSLRTKQSLCSFSIHYSLWNTTNHSTPKLFLLWLMWLIVTRLLQHTQGIFTRDAPCGWVLPWLALFNVISSCINSKWFAVFAISIVVKLHIIITTLNLMASGSLAGTHQIPRTANTWKLQFNGIFQLWTELCCDKYRGDVSSAGARLKLHRLWSCINAAVRVSCCFVNVKFRRGPF